jgi:hypothetical protein
MPKSSMLGERSSKLIITLLATLLFAACAEKDSRNEYKLMGRGFVSLQMLQNDAAGGDYHLKLIGPDTTINDTLGCTAVGTSRDYNFLYPGKWLISATKTDAKPSASTEIVVNEGLLTTVVLSYKQSAASFSVVEIRTSNFAKLDFTFDYAGAGIWRGMTDNRIYNKHLLIINPGIEYARTYFIFNETQKKYDLHRLGKVSFDFMPDGSRLKLHITGHDHDSLMMLGGQVIVSKSGQLLIPTPDKPIYSNYYVKASHWYHLEMTFRVDAGPAGQCYYLIYEKEKPENHFRGLFAMEEGRPIAGISQVLINLREPHSVVHIDNLSIIASISNDP